MENKVRPILGYKVSAATCLAALTADAEPFFEIQRSFLKGPELRLIVETREVHGSILPDALSATSDAKGWLLLVDLSSKRLLCERTM